MNIIKINEVSFDVSEHDLQLIKEIVDKFVNAYYFDDTSQLLMSLQAVTASQGLNLSKMLNGSVSDLIHDVIGIHGHVSHETGMLDFGKFKPKCERKIGEKNE